ncbi:hypothetical protein TVAG_412490 [Trichomonas vaginalis G3]|uniref:F5/8 type C domain containing protein n=1 Tax=Trichomonas vaginalis (strain ATCC PRA-98 / G3) TaxID=412133 RepID=A2EV62_TRIV3|nr:protein ubiquitination [Trichomonas vaginalis G3]EAY03445.1 hypothetical protein TVAG_412490 [Trichomonas vaginalis G3]KAI5486179.1 protein ubiquitination [Trichomonas vaginalis G3]|eukprot:XP_001315668.1 hypothetical protein [Trichomonas vaginalis G3]
MNSFSLTSKGLAGALKMQANEDFAFIVGGHQYVTNRFFAGFLSPKIAQMCLTDPFIDTFEININDESFQFQKIIDLQNGTPLLVSNLEAEYLTLIGNMLGNDEILSEGVKLQSSREKLSIQNALQILSNKNRYLLEADEEIKFVALNFWNFPIESLEKLDIPILEKILTNEQLKINNESGLFHFILRVIKLHDSTAHILLNYIHYEYLPQSDLNIFLKMIQPQDITGPIWKSLCSRLLNTPEGRDQKSSEIYVHYDKKDPLHGIIADLTPENSSNSSIKQIIDVTASSSEHNQPYYVIMPEMHDYWYSEEEKNPWLKFDFKQYQIKPTHYTLQSFNCGQGYSHMKSWVLEGLKEDDEWDILDTRTDNNDLNKVNGRETFECVANRYYRYIRLRMTGKNHFDGYYMCLQRIEFFGSYIK